MYHPDNIPEGWMLVPEVPTPQMVDACCALKLERLLDFVHERQKESGGVRRAVVDEWKIMLAAAPSPPIFDNNHGSECADQ